MFVYKQYDQTALDRQYNNRLQVPEYAIHLQRWEDTSREAEKKFKSLHDIAYGDHERERLDIYPSSKKKAKTLVFIHGGYWQKLDKSLFQFVAEAFLPYEFTIVLITYPLAPSASLDTIVASCKKAVQWIHANIHQYNGDPDEVYVAGHSAGGHLAVMLMTAGGPHSNTPFPAGLIKGVCAMSGLFDLEPIRISEINEIMKLDEHAVAGNSPVDLIPVCPCPMAIAVGAGESDEFIAQSEALYFSWQKHNVPMELLRLPAINHYSIVESFADKNSSLHAAMLQLMNYNTIPNILQRPGIL
jgi:arylformamidase